MTSRSSENPVLVQMRGVWKSYGAMAPVVRDLNLDVARGEFLSLLGPSGSGKTTTLMMLAGFESATEGEILVEGRSVGGLPPHRRGIGMVFQSYALFPHMTVAENLAFPLQVRKVARSEIEERVKRALDMVELGSFGARRPARLSGGQQQRVALARALIFEPTLVLMDEPLGALDKHLREQMQYEIKSIHNRLGVTMVYVTHDQSEALTMSDRIAVFGRGVIQHIASPEEIYRRPKNGFVASFIGENNTLPATVEACSADGTCQLKLRGGQTIAAAGDGAFATGDEVMLSVRPESIRLAEGANGLKGAVVDTIYHGDHLRLQVRVDDVPVIVKLAPGAAPVRLDRGTPVSLAIRPEDARVLPADQPAAG